MFNNLYKLLIILLGGLMTPLLASGADNTLHDPTLPSSYSDVSTINLPSSDIRISSIIVGEDRKVVIIGDHAFNIGEKVSDATIIAIERDGITLKDEDGIEFKVFMSSPNIKKPITNNKKKTL